MQLIKIQNTILIHDPVQSGGLRVQSTGLHQTYIRYVCCIFLESGQFVIMSESSLADSTGLHRTPTYLYYSQILISRGFSPVDSGGLTGPPSLNNTQFFIPVDSSGFRRTQHVTICDKVGVRSSPVESSRVHWSPADSGGTCGGV